MKKALALFLVLLLLIPYAAADGMMFIEDKDMWSLQPEQNQIAAVNYEDGMENLLISVSPGSEFVGSRAVWIFPVPAAPGTVKTDVLKGYPRLTGGNFENHFSDAVRTATGAQILYATFPLSCFGGAAVVLSFMSGMAGSIGGPSDIIVYDRVEKMGVTTEVVSATSADSLRNYLIQRGMDPKVDERNLLQDYIGKNYTFVVTSIADVQKFRNQTAPAEVHHYYREENNWQANQVGVFVRFPTDRIYYPLKPTAAYGSREVPVLLYVTGYVSPVLYDAIESHTGVTYFTEDRYVPDSALLPFFNGKTDFPELKYTKIKITVPSDKFTDDLWIDPTPPAGTAFREWYIPSSAVVSVIVYILFSALASFIAGVLVFRKKTVDRTILLLHGLWNCATFIGFAIATRKKFPQAEYGKRGPYVLVFYVVFALLLSVYTMVLAPSLGLEVILAWIIAVLSPILSLLLLAGIPMLLDSLSYSANASVLFVAGASIVLFILALCPIPVLIWLKRWLDPEVAGAAEQK